MLPPVIYRIASASVSLSPSLSHDAYIDWRAVVLTIWALGAMIVAALGMRAQRHLRKRLHDAKAIVDVNASDVPILRVNVMDIGPALVGAWRACIVVPADFDERYDSAELELIIAHEAMHLRRGDGWWSLFAQVALTLFWFNPLAWYALRVMRHDCELACDAAVLRQHGMPRHTYAKAMLKTQSASFFPPVGCGWSPRHPVMERIAMLKHVEPTARYRFAGRIAVALAVCSVAGIAYAATLPVAATIASGDRYMLSVNVALDGKPAQTHMKQCVKPGQSFLVSGMSDGVPPWSGSFSVRPVDQGLIEIQGTLSGGMLTAVTHPVIKTKLGQQAIVMVGNRRMAVAPDQAASAQTIKIDFLPTAGC
jgi:beta-lactamase regulating signal transducer with metallopeptidase domain